MAIAGEVRPVRLHRRSIRLKGYAYSQAGAYFITACTKDRLPLFGTIRGDGVRLSAFGIIVREEWDRSAAIRPEIGLDAFVIMPDHIHGIVWFGFNGRGRDHIRDSVGAHRRAPLPVPTPATDPGHARVPRSLGSFIAGFKSVVTKRINEMRHTPGTPVWQRNYYERIIRDSGALRQIRRYIALHPVSLPEFPWDSSLPAHTRFTLYSSIRC